jgi:hypothetical protein
VFDWSNLEQLEAEFPHAKGEAFLLGILDRGDRAGITDLVGEPTNVFCQAYMSASPASFRVRLAEGSQSTAIGESPATSDQRGQEGHQ